ncbi:MAG: hypothetical protein IPM79_05845 [Polyangiaceae bacterium]|nr:hypothetical protein [Polyangiaceae bacterium]MBK8937162.1 hypothetical protein [Polyangiaceae bacterium]
MRVFVRRALSVFSVSLLAGCTPPVDKAIGGAETAAPEGTSAPAQPELRVEVGLLEQPADAEPKPQKPVEKKKYDKDLKGNDGPTRAEAPPEGTPSTGDLTGGDTTKSDGKITAATTESTGGHVEPSAVRDAVAAQLHLFSRCLRADASIEIEVTVAPSGRVIEARSSRSVPDDPKLRDCLVAAFKQLTISPHDSSAAARVRLAVALKRL